MSKLLFVLFVALASACFDFITFQQCAEFCAFTDECLILKCYVWCSKQHQCFQAFEQECSEIVLSSPCYSNTDCNGDYNSLFKNITGHTHLCNEKPCPSGTTCANREGAYICLCPTGEYWNQTTNVCAPSPCDGMSCAGGYCMTDQFLNPSCVCSGTKIWSQTKNACVQGPCLNANCPSESLCLPDFPAGYYCLCPTGLAWNSVSNICDVDPCLSNPCQGDGVTCNPTVLFSQFPYECFCSNQTQTYNYTSNQCEPFSYCDNDNCPSNSICNSEPWSYSCVCNSGHWIVISNTCQPSNSTSLSIQVTTATSAYSSGATLYLNGGLSSLTLNENFTIGVTSIGP